MTTQGVGWVSEEASDLVAPPLDLVLYMHLRIFAYTSNVLIASFEYMELANLQTLPESWNLETCKHIHFLRSGIVRWCLRLVRHQSIPTLEVNVILTCLARDQGTGFGF
jgi:hypothetical protein